jgi:hypothetical protein
MLVTGDGKRQVGSFQQEVTQAKGSPGLHGPSGDAGGDGADRSPHPGNPTAYALWAEAELVRGNSDKAAELRQIARTTEYQLQDYAGIAALYFRMAWQDGKPVIRTPWECMKSTVGIAASDRDM